MHRRRSNARSSPGARRGTATAIPTDHVAQAASSATGPGTTGRSQWNRSDAVDAVADQVRWQHGDPIMAAAVLAVYNGAKRVLGAGRRLLSRP